MPRLNKQQNNFIDTINKGPATLDPALFSGPADRVLLGLKAHANTISHARLVALEETFPMTRNMLGDDMFNGLSRSFTETEAGRASDANNIGADFPDFLIQRDVNQSAVDLSKIEWAWLESYNAAEAQPMELSLLGTLDEASLLTLPISLHPAARMIRMSAPLSDELSELGDSSGKAAILISRPEAEVILLPIGELDALIFDALVEQCEISNLLELILEQGGEDAPLEPILTLIGAGALITTG